MAFIPSSLDDDSIPANARVWDFVMPPESCWTIPLSSECVSGKRLCLGLVICCNRCPSVKALFRVSGILQYCS
jgi:hypothetical protein